MKRTLICNLSTKAGEDIMVQGFVQTLRDQSHMQFLIVDDHTGSVQVVNEKSKSKLNKEISSLTQGSTVSIIGTLVANDRVKLNGYEIQLEQLTIETLAETPLPINSLTELDKRLDWRFLDLRSSRNLLIFRIQTAIEEAMREYWHENDFLEIHSPKLMPTASESGAELFQLPYFDWATANLAQSPQFYKQMAMMAGFNRVFEIGPVFRANKSFTPRHDTEFTSVDMEVAWINNHDDLMTLEENWLRHILSRISDQYGEQIEKEFGITVTIPKLPFPRIPLAEARRILASKDHIIPPGDDLDPKGERLLAEYIKSTTGHEFVFVPDFDTSIRPFYHMRHPDNPDLTRSFDLIWKGTEITTGAQREHRVKVLERQILEKGLYIEPLKPYIDFFRYGAPPHGGMGVGLTRILMLLLGLRNVREVTYLFRGPTRLTP